jgi:penicillin-binding protein 1C
MNQDDLHDGHSEQRPTDEETSSSPDQTGYPPASKPQPEEDWYAAESPFLDDTGPAERPAADPSRDDARDQTSDEHPQTLQSSQPATGLPDLGRTAAMRPTPGQPPPGPPPPTYRQTEADDVNLRRAAQPPVYPSQPTPSPSPSTYQQGGADDVNWGRTAQPSAYPSQAAPSTGQPRPVPQRTGYVAAPGRKVVPPVPQQRPAQSAPRRRGRDRAGCLLRVIVISILVLVVLFFAAVAIGAVGYVYVGQQLPPADELWGRQTAWVSSRIYDRNGQLLWELLDPHGGRRTRVTLDQVSPFLLDATIATEDEAFWQHRGFSPFAIARAVYQNLRAREIVSGFSTITQQVARNVLLSPEERSQETASRKIKEVILAVEIERRYDKDQILEIYLNENNYGNLAYGIEAAAQTYFQKSAGDLNLTESSLLAGLPQSPSIHDPLVNPDGALARQKDVLRLMVEATKDGYLNPGITQEQADAAAAEMAARITTLTPPRSDIPAPHFVQYVREQVEAEFGPELLYRDVGLRIFTSLDRDLQQIAEEEVRTGVANLADRNATNGALVAIDPRNGEILAMVGSVDFNNESIGGQVNVATRCRQPGSSIKPLTYLAAFERGWTPSALIWDVQTGYPNPPNPPYVPVNYDGKYHGNTLLRSALANSYNVPAVKALDSVGVDGLLDMAERLGVVSLRHPEQYCPEYPYDAPPAYGLSLTLGGGETKLLEMTGAFAVFANGGVRLPPTAIRYIENANADLIADYRERPGGRVISSQHAYLITDILSDYNARCPAFGCPNTLQLDDRAAAAKTGTTTDYRDALTVGYTPELVTGVWVGNSDNSPMTDVPGSRGAGPIWKGFMTRALASVPPSTFERPPGIVEHEICVDSGTSPSPYCPSRRLEIFAESQPPLDASHDLWQAIGIDRLSGLRANEFCPDNVEEKVFFVVPPEEKEAREWVIARGYEQPPDAFCTEGTRPQVSITSPQYNETIPQGLVPVMGQVQLPNFEHYELTYGIGTDPQGWGWISGPHLAPVADGELTVWDTTHLKPGLFTLRVVAYSQDGAAVEARVIVNVAGPTPTATQETPTPTALVPTLTPPILATIPPILPTLPPIFPTQSPTATPTPEAIVPTPESEATPAPEPITPTLAPLNTPPTP